LNEGLNTETEAYFATKDKSFYKIGTEMLDGTGMIVWLLIEITLMNKANFDKLRFLPLGTFQPM